MLCAASCVLACLALIHAAPEPAPPAVGPEIVYVGNGYDSLWVMNADGSNATRILRKANSSINSPCWSPDGSEIAFMASINKSCGVWIIGADGSNLRQIVVAQGCGIRFVSWSPAPTADGSYRIAFTGDNYDIYLVRPDGSGLVRLTTSGAFGPLDWSSDATRIAATKAGIVALDVGAAAGQPILTGTTTLHSGAFVYSPCWDVGDDRVFFLEDFDIAYVDATVPNGPVHYVTNTSFDEEHLGGPSPDGARLIYARVVNKAFRLYSIGVDGAGETLLSANGCKPSWRAP